jgi:hypothetical protein
MVTSVIVSATTGVIPRIFCVSVLKSDVGLGREVGEMFRTDWGHLGRVLPGRPMTSGQTEHRAYEPVP